MYYEKRSIGEPLKHPLVNLVVGFLLTGVLGTTLTQYYIAQREEQTQKRELSNTGRKQLPGTKVTHTGGSLQPIASRLVYELSQYTVSGQVNEALQVNQAKYRNILSEECATPD